MGLLRIFPQNSGFNYNRDDPRFSNINEKSSKVVPVDSEVDLEGGMRIDTNFEESCSVKILTCDTTGSVKRNDSFLLEDGEHEEEDCFDKPRRVKFADDLIHVSKYEYYLRDRGEVEDRDHDDILVLSNYLMRRALFEEELSDIIKDDGGLVKQLHEIIYYETLHGPNPNLPFSLESFLTFLFVESRDLRLIRVMLRVCQNYPTLLGKFDQKLKANGSGIGVRENLMLQFYANVREIDEVAAKSAIQLMGFRNIVHLMSYYRETDNRNAVVNDALWKLGFDDGVGDSGGDNEKYYEYIYDYDMIE